jgi:hypothetical protein
MARLSAGEGELGPSVRELDRQRRAVPIGTLSPPPMEVKSCQVEGMASTLTRMYFVLARVATTSPRKRTGSWRPRSNLCGSVAGKGRDRRSIGHDVRGPVNVRRCSRS